MITSIQNKYVKQWRKLRTKKERIKTGTFIVEGFHLVEEACKSNWVVQQLIIQDGIEIPHWCNSLPITKCTEAVFHHIAQTETPQGIAAVVEMMKQEEFTGDHVMLLDKIQDPGNLGTIIRTADAARFAAVIIGTGSVDMFNDKVIRATQGSLFHIPVIEAGLQDKINKLKNSDYKIWAAALSGATDFNLIKTKEKTAIIVGNEGAGIQDNLLALADEIVKIPIYGKAESLNVSVAAGILMYYLRS